MVCFTESIVFLRRREATLTSDADSRSLRDLIAHNRNRGFHKRKAFARVVNENPADVRDLAKVLTRDLEELYVGIFGDVVGADSAVKRAVARDIRNGVMTVMSHRMAMESIPRLLSSMTEAFVLPVDVQRLSAQRYVGDRERTYEGVEAVLLQHQAPHLRPNVVAGLQTFGRDLPCLSEVFADASRGMKEATRDLLDIVIKDGVTDEMIRQDPLNNKNFPPDIRRLLNTLNVSDVPAIVAERAQLSGMEVATSAIIDARRVLHASGCDETQTHVALLLDVEALASSVRLPDFVADQRYVRRRQDLRRKLPFVSRWSPDKGRHVLETVHPQKSIGEPGRGGCAAADELLPVIGRHVDDVAKANNVLASTLSPFIWHGAPTLGVSEISMLIPAALTHELAEAGQFIFPERRIEAKPVTL
jgi:hypothetical protein